MQMKFATVSALLLFFVAAAPAAPDARNGLKIPLTKRATFIKENGVVDLETLRSRHARIQAYVDLLATMSPHPQLTFLSNLVRSTAASRTTRRTLAMFTRTMFTVRPRSVMVDLALLP